MRSYASVLKCFLVSERLATRKVLSIVSDLILEFVGCWCEKEEQFNGREAVDPTEGERQMMCQLTRSLVCVCQRDN